MEASRRLISSFRKFTIRPEAVRLRYHGKSSSLMLLQAAVDMRAKYDGVPSEDILMPPLDPTGMPRVDVEETLRSNVYSAYSTFARIALGEDMRPFTDFPPPDLMHKLVDAYFTNMNVFVPVLHRQILEQGIEEGLHLRDEGFGGVVLLVCANGCGWLKDSDNPRIAEASENRRPGFKWFLQVERSRRSILATPRLYDLQRFLVRLLISSPHKYARHESLMPLLLSVDGVLPGEFWHSAWLLVSHRAWYSYGPRRGCTSPKDV